MKSYIERIMEAHPEWPRRIKHGDYIGVLSGAQPLLEGESAPLYRFPGGECVGVDFELPAVRTPAKDAGLGLACCGECGAELLCNEFGDMPDVCPVCHEGIDWSEYRGGDCGETV